ncbi:hypothetical protein RJ639_017922 [Escallonia herrerae]|uniref:Uncharacterized protein n=1 Tax=Escallonia herrerae TaxID=1293975 RepID=A0AA89AHT6_9ASTE|nr:hypothetical protein RJ639_017922 [Escallonia herrerae]
MLMSFHHYRISFHHNGNGNGNGNIHHNMGVAAVAPALNLHDNMGLCHNLRNTALAGRAIMAFTYKSDANHYDQFSQIVVKILYLHQDKFKLRLKTIEEGLKHASSSPVNPKAVCGSPKPGKSTHFFGILSANAVVKKRSTSQPRASTISASSQQPDVENGAGTAAGKLTRVNSLTKKHATGENLLRKSLWASRSKVLDIDEKENKEMQQNTTVNVDKFKDNETRISEEVKIEGGGNEELQIKGTSNSSSDEMVSGFLYDRLQKEVESKKVKKAAATREQDAASAQVDDNKRNRKTNSSKSSHSLQKGKNVVLYVSEFWKP